MYQRVTSYCCVLLCGLILLEASSGSKRPGTNPALKQNESSARRKDLENGCRVLETLEGELAECRGQSSVGKVNCSFEASPENTIAEIRCRQFWNPARNSSSTTKKVCNNREWISETIDFACELECGAANYETRVDRGTERIQKSSSPWVTGIFYTEDPATSQQGFKFICQGTLISTRAIITSALCVTFPNSSVDRRPEALKVALGNLSRSIYTSIGLYQDVEKVVLHQEYNPTDLSNDIALIWLTEPIRVEADRHPICLPDEDEEVDVGSEGKVRVLGGEVETEKTLSVISSANCRKNSSALAHQLKPTKFCTQANNDLSICNSFGTGLAFPNSPRSQKWTVHGIRSGRMNQSAQVARCASPILFTKVARFRQWIDRELSREPPVYSQVHKAGKGQNPRLTPTPGTRTNTHFTTPSPSPPREREPLTPEPFLIPHYTSPKASEIEALPKSTVPPVPYKVVSGNGSTGKFPIELYPPIPTRFPISTQRTQRPRFPAQTTHVPTTEASVPSAAVAEKTTVEPIVLKSGNGNSYHCPPLAGTQGISQLCKQDEYEDIDDCSNGGQIGTVATLACDKYYKSAFGPPTLRKECMGDKRWSAPRPFGCTLECGISSSPRRSLIVNGILSNRASWPWHATIFKKSQNDFRYICGGTLISRTLLITAAHCVSHPMSTKTVDLEDLRIVLASTSSNYTHNLFDPISQPNLFYVKRIVLPDTYNGVTFESDIALIQLEFSVQLSDYVKPVCFPFQSKENADIVQLHLSPGTQGHTVGFGIDETGSMLRSMKETSLPVVSHRECAQVLARFPSSSQFCAGFINGSSAVCNGDSGSGLVFSDGTGLSNRYIIQGIVSYGEFVTGSLACNHKSYAVFTKVSHFAGWVQEQLNILEPEF